MFFQFNSLSTNFLMQRLPCGPELLAPWERVAHAGTPSHSEDPQADQFPEVPHSHPAIQDEARPAALEKWLNGGLGVCAPFLYSPEPGI